MHLIKIFLLSITLLFASAVNSYAYLDPGTFSIIINFFIAIAAGVAVYVSLFWNKIKSFFIKQKDIDKKDDKKP